MSKKKWFVVVECGSESEANEIQGIIENEGISTTIEARYIHV